MNTIITLRRLIDLLAKSAQCEPATAEAFLKAYTNQISGALANGETVVIKELGTFSVDDNGRAIFVPDKDLAAAVNEPFEMFQPEELEPEISEASLNAPYVAPAKKGQEENAPEEKAAVEVPKAEPQPVEAEDEGEAAQEPISIANPSEPELPEEEEEEVPETKVQEEVAPAPAPAKSAIPEIKPWEDEEEDEEEENAQQEENNSESSAFPWFWSLMGLLIGLIIGLAIGFFVHDPIQEYLEPSLAQTDGYDYDSELAELQAMLPEDSVESETPAEESVEESSTAVAEETAQPAETPKEEEKPQPKTEEKKTEADAYDTIRPGTTLAKLARQRYGHDVYWVYIYLENQKSIPNPNRVPEGLKVKIPPLSKYAPQATEEERRAAAQKELAKVLAKHPK